MWWLMPALDIAVRLKQAEAEVNPAPISDALSALLKEVEQVLV